MQFTCAEPANLIALPLADACGVIVRSDCPGIWPEFPALVAAEFESGDSQRACRACSILRCAFKRYGYSPRATLENYGLDAPKTAGFRLIDVVNGILTPNVSHMLLLARAGAAGSDAASGHMAHKAIKAWFSAVRTDVPAILASPEALTVWMSVCNDVICKDVSALLPATTPDLQMQKHPWWKAKKWAMRAVIRLAESHAVRAYDAAQMAKHGQKALDSEEKLQVGRMFSERFAGPFASTIFAMLRSGVKITSRVYSYGLVMFQAMCSHEFGHLFNSVTKPVALPLITEVIMPKLLIEPDDATLAVDDPDEFFAKYHGSAALESDLPMLRAIQTLKVVFLNRIDSLGTPFLTWAAKQLAAIDMVPQATRDWRAKEAILHALCEVSSAFLRSPAHCAAAEPILLTFCAPELSQPNPALKSRAISTIASFVELEVTFGFKNRSIIPSCVTAAVAGIEDSNPAVAAASSELLMSAAAIPSARPLYRPHIRRIVFKCLELMGNMSSSSNTSDALSFLMGKFATDVIIDAPNLMRLLIERFKFAAANAEEDDTEHSASNANNLTTCIIIILSAPGMTPSMGRVLEEMLLPVLASLLVPGPVLEYFDEVCTIINELIRINKGVSPALWAAFVPIVELGNSYCADFIDTLAPLLDTYICVDPARLRVPLANSVNHEHPTPRSPLDLMWEVVMSTERREESDQVHASYVMSAVLLYLPPGSEDFLTTVVKHYGGRLAAPAAAGGCASGHTQTAFAGVLATAILRNQATTLGLLHSSGLVPTVFMAMARPLENMDDYGAPDIVIKGIMLAMMHILQVEPTTLPPSVSGALSAVLTTAAAFASARMDRAAAAIEEAASKDKEGAETPAQQAALEAAAMRLAAGDAADAADSAEFKSLFGEAAAPVTATLVGPDMKPLELGDLEIGAIVDDEDGFYKDDNDALPDDVDYGTLDGGRVSGDVPIAQVDTLLEFSKLMAFWQSPARAAGLAHISAGLSAETKEQLSALSADAAEHVATLRQRQALMTSNAASPTKMAGVPAPGQAGDPSLHGTLNSAAVHALAAAAAATSERLRTYVGKSTVSPEQRAAIDRAAALAAQAAAAAAASTPAVQFRSVELPEADSPVPSSAAAGSPGRWS